MKPMIVLATVLAIPLATHAHPDGAPPGHTGGFGEASCHACHFDAAPREDDARLRIEGLPQRFEAGRAYSLTLVVDEEAPLHGFQLSARDAVGRQAGELDTDDDGARTVEYGGVQYLGHTEDGARRGGHWAFTWRAPDGVRQVVFHVAAVAANGDRSEFGDLVILYESLSAMERR